MVDIFTSTCLELWIEETKDKNKIKDILSHKEIEDITIERDIDNYIKTFKKEDKCYLLYMSNECVGIIIIRSLLQDFGNTDWYCPHIGLLKKVRGKIGLKLIKKAIIKFSSTTHWTRLIGLIPLRKKNSLMTALWSGFELKEKGKQNYYVEYKRV